MILRNLRVALACATALTACALQAEPAAPPAADAASAPSLEDQFRDPPNAARPRVWWHWMNGNVTKDGIAKDMAWMKRVGIGGLQNFDANLNTPQVVKDRLIYMRPDWKDAFRFAATEADRLGLELAIAASPGWSETGGPWVKPEDGLKKLVWSETELMGGKRFAGKLAPPPSATGPFQSIDKGSGIGSLLSGDKGPQVPTFYADVAVLAVPLARAPALAAPVVRDGADEQLDGGALADADLNTTVDLKRPASGVPSLVFAYSAPQTLRSATLFIPGAAALFMGAAYAPVLEASDDGAAWRKVADIAVTAVPTTIGFAPVTARQFRVTFGPAKPSSAMGNFMASAAPGLDLAGLGAAMGSVGAPAGMGGGAKPVKIGELRLSGEERIDRFETKAGFEVERDYYHLDQALPEARGVDPARVIDLTGRLRPDGTLDWTPPKLPGGARWRVLRLGYSLLGTTNHPAPPEATGLEVDKFDGPAVRRYLEHYIGMYRDAAGADLIGKRGVQAILTDSIEVGAANWTPQMLAQFKRLRGYDAVPWLPALTGTIVGSRADSDRFLYDYRRTLADLMASEHYGTVAKVAHENGLKVYGEALESGRPSLGDDMSMRRFADIPMSAMWTHARKVGPQQSHVADIKGAASVAHVYGQNLVAAESLTSALSYWDHAPAYLKRIIDLEFVTGVNRPVIHTSVHQPVDEKVPGLSLFIFGQYFNRHEAWAELAKPWVDYISRNSLMLQQGRNLADVGYFYGEEAPLTALYEKEAVADAPKAYAYDFVSADALMSALANDGNELTTPGGARYRVLYLGGSSRRMTLPALRKLAALVEGGATVVGMKPEGDPSLAANSTEYAALAAKLWNGGEVTQIGKGRVIASTDIEAALAKIGVAPDFRFTGGQDGAAIPFVHRKLPDGDSYFLVNQQDRGETIEARFRVTGKTPELWHSETGNSEALSYRTEGGETIVPLTLAADESVHVVFRKPAVAPTLAIKKLVPSEVGRIDGPWQVAFQANRGAPAKATFASLAPLDENADAGIKYFSGIATYTNGFTTPKGWKRGEPLWIDLGEAREVAEVTVNGRPAGYAWHAPYRVDVSQTAKPGRNTLQVRVANLWVNRLIGDRQPDAKPITWTALPTYTAKAPLRRSGLIGPVTLLGQPK
ncbi:glycosyl hydrolase [Novosphingobium sp. JCM 18896]|uniref:glycosyl hydrolase n=1 Tax=Novosphingobium sp. JCM 18896 TaxID=2989731 RepID=UPI002223DEB1|nr:glycosyl hydrolase [Novosphingobium sp. JCM 18896]MCW1429490.1 glycosyl hydrolase [Novosphingobium sp. JCM 18896]